MDTDLKQRVCYLTEYDACYVKSGALIQGKAYVVVPKSSNEPTIYGVFEPANMTELYAYVRGSFSKQATSVEEADELNAEMWERLTEGFLGHTIALTSPSRPITVSWHDELSFYDGSAPALAESEDNINAMLSLLSQTELTDAQKAHLIWLLKLKSNQVV